MAAIKIIDGIWQVGGGSWGKVAKAVSVEGCGNMYLVGGKGQFAIIDAGIPAGVKVVVANAAEAGAGPGQIKRIVLTHAHSDHVAGAEDLHRATGAVLAAHPLTAAALAGEPEAVTRLFVGEMRATVAETIADGAEVALGPYRFRAIHTPGHMPDCVCLFGQVAGRRVLISGDEVIGDQGEDLGVVGWLDMHWGSAPKRYVASLEKLAALRADLMLPGHGKPLDGERAVADSLAHGIARLRQLLAIPHLHTMMGLDMSE